jgi:hypothetical protein
MNKEDKYKKVFNPSAFVGVRKSEFKEQYKGKVPFDLNEVWDWISKNRPSKPKSNAK